MQPKLEDVNKIVSACAGNCSGPTVGTASSAKRLEELEDFAIELKEFHDELLRGAVGSIASLWLYHLSFLIYSISSIFSAFAC